MLKKSSGVIFGLGPFGMLGASSPSYCSERSNSYTKLVKIFRASRFGFISLIFSAVTSRL